MGEGGRSPDEGGAARAEPTAFARNLRRNGTEVEKRLWAILRDRRLVGFKFRRQVPIGPYIADFACYEAKLVVELDGSQHYDNRFLDARRDAELSRRGFKVIRVWNSEVNDNRDGVLELILDTLTRRAAPPSSALRAPSPIKGEGSSTSILAPDRKDPR
jgi:very-short-patch-repair endonuclease